MGTLLLMCSQQRCAYGLVHTTLLFLPGHPWSGMLSILQAILTSRQIPSPDEQETAQVSSK